MPRLCLDSSGRHGWVVWCCIRGMLLSVLCVIVQVICMVRDLVVNGQVIRARRCPVVAASFALAENSGPSVFGAGTSAWKKGDDLH
jgi:hypothetical protein